MNTLFEIMARNIDKYNLYDHILLNEGAYFFKRGNASISKVSIEELFSSVAEEQVVLASRVSSSMFSFLIMF